MLIGIVLLLGAVGLIDMPWELFPKVGVPIITVVVPYPGAGPEEIEQRVLKPLEDECAIIENVDAVHGHARQNVAVLAVQFRYGTDLDVGAANVRDAVSVVKGKFPDGAKEPSVMKVDIGAQPVITFGVTGNRPPQELLKLVEDRIKPNLGSIAGVANVALTGGQQREMSA
jgi:multidrug efflux pump subunit AcrB